MKFSPKCSILCLELKQDRGQLKKSRGVAGEGQEGWPTPPYRASWSTDIPSTWSFDVFLFLFLLRFYRPVNPMGSCRARSVYLTTHLLGRLSPLSG